MLEPIVRFARVVATVLVLTALVAVTSPEVEPAETARRVTIGPISLMLPATQHAVLTKTFPDAWFGFLANTTGSPRIQFGMGHPMTPAITPSSRKQLRWVKQEQLSFGQLEYGVDDSSDELIFKATIAFANFTATLRSEQDVEVIVQVLRSIAPRCSECEKASHHPN